MTLSRLPHDLCGRGMRTARVIGWERPRRLADVVRRDTSTPHHAGWHCKMLFPSRCAFDKKRTNESLACYW